MEPARPGRPMPPEGVCVVVVNDILPSLSGMLIPPVVRSPPISISGAAAGGGALVRPARPHPTRAAPATDTSAHRDRAHAISARATSAAQSGIVRRDIGDTADHTRAACHGSRRAGRAPAAPLPAPPTRVLQRIKPAPVRAQPPLAVMSCPLCQPARVHVSHIRSLPPRHP